MKQFSQRIGSAEKAISWAGPGVYDTPGNHNARLSNIGGNCMILKWKIDDKL